MPHKKGAFKLPSKPKRPTKPSEYRRKWQGTLETTPSGLTVKMRFIDPLEYYLLFVDPEKVREYEFKSAQEIEAEVRDKISSIKPEEIMEKLLTTIVEEPRIVRGEPKSENEIGIDEIKPLDRRALLAAALNHIGLIGRSSELRKFRGLQPTEAPDKRVSREVPSTPERPSGSTA